MSGCAHSGEVQDEREAFIQAQTPGTHDVLVFEHNPERAGRPGGIVHFGFRLVDPAAITGIIDKVIDAGGKILDRGDFAPGMPYVFFADPDGHEVEVWFEAATALDPR
jgi:catechol 2,3-dioxygenase-like lactoylglutathione lyase family enzyme